MSEYLETIKQIRQKYHTFDETIKIIKTVSKELQNLSLKIQNDLISKAGKIMIEIDGWLTYAIYYFGAENIVNRTPEGYYKLWEKEEDKEEIVQLISEFLNKECGSQRLLKYMIKGMYDHILLHYNIDRELSLDYLESYKSHYEELQVISRSDIPNPYVISAVISNDMKQYDEALYWVRKAEGSDMNQLEMKLLNAINLKLENSGNKDKIETNEDVNLNISGGEDITK